MVFAFFRPTFNASHSISLVIPCGSSENNSFWMRTFMAFDSCSLTSSPFSMPTYADRAATSIRDFSTRSSMSPRCASDTNFIIRYANRLASQQFNGCCASSNAL